jgi:CheY-like chemotaxis protein
VRKTVLIAEDDASVAQLLRDVLEAEGFEVLVEVDGESALRAIESKPLHLLITDLLIPKLKGFELIEKARKTTAGRDLPIIVVSGVYRATNFRDDLVQKQHIADYFDKPIDVDRLIDTLHDLFSSAYPDPKPSGEHRVVLPEVRPTLDVPERGDLAQIPFATVLGRLYRARSSGALMLRKASIKKIVYLRDGVPVFVKSNLLAECLGRIMVQERLISQEECDESLQRKKKEKKSQGQILMQMGSISLHNLEFALELQMQTKLFDLFSWLEGRYQFNSSADHSTTNIGLPMAPTALIYEGASRAMSNERIARELARVGDSAMIAADDPSLRYQTLQLDPRADRLVDKLDGTRTIAQLLDEAQFDRVDAALLLYALSCAGLIEPVLSSPEPIPLDEADVEVLSTGEINAIAQLANVSNIDALDPVTEPPPPTNPPPVPSALDEEVDDSELEEPLDGVTEEAFSMADVFQSDPGLPDERKPSALSLPRESKWPKREGEMSDDIRRQVRERLEAHVKKIADERTSNRPRSVKDAKPIAKKFPTKPSNTSYRLRTTPRDTEKDKKLEADLTERLELMESLTYYELLEIAEDARVEVIRTAYHALARKHDPERVAAASTSRLVHRLAEQIYLLLTRALNTLTHDQARLDYDRRIGLSQRREADLIAAETAFELGTAASARGDWRAARELFERAVRLNREEGVYLAHLGWAHYQGEANEDRALELLDRAAEKSPRTEEVHLFTAQIHEKAGRKAEAVRAYQRAVACNPDCVRALEALKVLDPPSHKRSGLLSRLNLN